MTVTYLDVSKQAQEYPRHLLKGCETGLCLFSAGFLGHNDVIHFARNAIQTTCVDTDADKLDQMRDIYSDGWDFIEADAFEFAQTADRQWDAVSVDPFMGNTEKRVRGMHDVFLALARKVATITVPRDYVPQPIDGWKVSVFPRSATASWLVCRVG